jgi:hypothetical protein
MKTFSFTKLIVAGRRLNGFFLWYKSCSVLWKKIKLTLPALRLAAAFGVLALLLTAGRSFAVIHLTLE